MLNHKKVSVKTRPIMSNTNIIWLSKRSLASSWPAELASKQHYSSSANTKTILLQAIITLFEFNHTPMLYANTRNIEPADEKKVICENLLKVSFCSQSSQVGCMHKLQKNEKCKLQHGRNRFSAQWKKVTCVAQINFMLNFMFMSWQPCCKVLEIRWCVCSCSLWSGSVGCSCLHCLRCCCEWMPSFTYISFWLSTTEVEFPASSIKRKNHSDNYKPNKLKGCKMKGEPHVNWGWQSDNTKKHRRWLQV